MAGVQLYIMKQKKYHKYYNEEKRIMIKDKTGCLFLDFLCMSRTKIMCPALLQKQPAC
jgi:hypothetical protein